MNKDNLNLNFEVSKDDFVFVQQEKKIHDKKFDTKPTTFAKDAFRRFCKNKSSVVGAIILGILILLAIFLPIFSTKNTKEVRLYEKFLAPKLFEAGTGFWDGTQKWKDVIYDAENDAPADFLKRSVSNLVVDEEPKYVNAVSKYGHGGYLAFINENEFVDHQDEEYDVEEFAKNLYFFNTVSFDPTKKNVVTIKFLDEIYPGTINGKYKISITYGDDDNFAEWDDEVILVDWTDSREELVINISEKLTEAGLGVLEHANFNISLEAADQSRASVLIKSIEFDCQGASAEALKKYSFTEGNEMVLRAQDEDTKEYPENYWQSTGQKNVYKVEVLYCSFTYDPYDAAYGLETVTMAASDFQKLIENGIIEYDYKVGPESFKILDADNCPIESVSGQELNKITKKLLNVQVEQYKYKKYGYSSAPKFLFGTDALGRDVVKYAFSGLRTSLILGVCTAAFCFIFGLVWGSVSGYFGGNVDLFMERFCDILSGVPWIVVMTLCILHLGQNFFTFFLALCLTGWMGTAGRTRTQFYRFKGREYVLASRTLGSSDMRLIFKHILPNSLGTIITGAVLMIPSVIFSEATIAYLNLGLRGLDSFGVMLSSNQRYITTYPNLILFPAVIMSLMMISFNLFGNGLRDAVNPSLKGGDM